jgi:hypothetical protein
VKLDRDASVQQEEEEQQRRRLEEEEKNQRELSAKFCPEGYSGKAPTKRCAGYLTCAARVTVGSVQACSGGTMFDLRTVTCTWPDAVDCKFGEEFAATIDKKGGGSDGM